MSVSGTTSWSATYTPSSDGSYTIRATVNTQAGTSDSTTSTFNANEFGAARKSCSDGTTVAPNEQCQIVDEEARQDAAEARQAAQDAKASAEEARDTAEEAKASAEEARNTLEGASTTLDELIQARRNASGEDQDGVPAPGLLALLAAIGGAMVLRRRD